MEPTGKGAPSTTTDPGARIWFASRDVVSGLRVWGTNVEHDFPVGGFDRIWIGQDPAGPGARHVLRIDHPTVSRRHATIEWRGPHLVVVDQGSKNGTRSEGQTQGIFELLPGAVVSFGAVDTVAYSPHTQRIRAGFRRFLGYSDAAQLDIERLQHGAARRQHVALIGPAGSGGRALARFLHDSLPANAWPFVTPEHLPDVGDRAGQRALVASAAYGTLVLDAGRRGVRYDKLPHVFDAIASNAYHVRLVVLATPTSSLEHIVGEKVRSDLLMVRLPSLEARRGELQILLADTVTYHCQTQGAAGNVLHPTDLDELAARIGDPRRGRRQMTTWDELEETVSRLVAIRKNGSARAAEVQLGMSVGSLSKWAAKHGWSLNRPGRPPGR